MVIRRCFLNEQLITNSATETLIQFSESLGLFYCAVRIVCGERHKTVEYPSVRLSVCPVDGQQQQRWSASLLLRSGAGSRYRPIAAAAARRAGRVNVGPTNLLRF